MTGFIDDRFKHKGDPVQMPEIFTKSLEINSGDSIGAWNDMATWFEHAARSIDGVHYGNFEVSERERIMRDRAKWITERVVDNLSCMDLGGGIL